MKQQEEYTGTTVTSVAGPLRKGDKVFVWNAPGDTKVYGRYEGHTILASGETVYHAYTKDCRLGETKAFAFCELASTQSASIFPEPSESPLKVDNNILAHANDIVNNRSEEKERQYGPFSACMIKAAAIYNLMSPKEEQITTRGMYRAMVAMKLAREAYSHKQDNLLDACAYLGAMDNFINEQAEMLKTDCPDNV